MLSKEMYTVLSFFPRKLGEAISYEKLLSNCKINEDDIIECLNETLYPSWNYVRSSNGWRTGSLLYLTESGLSKLEEYESSLQDQEFSKITLTVAKIALAVSILGVIIAIISIFK